MKKIFLISGIIILSIFFYSCSNYDNYCWYVYSLNMENNIKYEFENRVRVAVIDTYLNSASNVNETISIVDSRNVILDNEDIYRNDVNHCSSVINLIASNGSNDIISFGMNSDIIPIVAFDENGETKPSILNAAFEYALMKRANIVCCSFGVYIDDALLRDTISKLLNNNVIIIAACGDKKLSHELYPARYDGVFSIATQDRNGNVYKQSNMTNKSILFPGVSIKVPIYFSEGISYDFVTGSSYANAIFCGFCLKIIMYK